MYKSHGAFETQLKLAEHALTSAKTKAKKLEDMKDKLETAFLKFDEDFRMKPTCVHGALVVPAAFAQAQP